MLADTLRSRAHETMRPSSFRCRSGVDCGASGPVVQRFIYPSTRRSREVIAAVRRSQYDMGQRNW